MFSKKATSFLWLKGATLHSIAQVPTLKLNLLPFFLACLKVHSWKVCGFGFFSVSWLQFLPYLLVSVSRTLYTWEWPGINRIRRGVVRIRRGFT